MHFMVDAAAKLNLEANYEKTFSITSQRFAAAKYFYWVGELLCASYTKKKLLSINSKGKKQYNRMNFIMILSINLFLVYMFNVYFS